MGIKIVRLKSGFTYMSVLALVSITGIVLSGASMYWSTIMNREREAELIFRGSQILKGITSFYNNSPASSPKSYPSKLEDLLRDPRYPTLKRHVRKIYKDPMTKNGQWGLILDPQKKIKGIYSHSKKIPIKKANFPEALIEFEKAKEYLDWKFVHAVKKKNGPRSKSLR